jgi:hypothetical protein
MFSVLIHARLVRNGVPKKYAPPSGTDNNARVQGRASATAGDAGQLK